MHQSTLSAKSRARKLRALSLRALKHAFRWDWGGSRIREESNPAISASRKNAFQDLVAGSVQDEPASKDERTWNLEARIGGVWLNRIGAIILLLAAAFLVKLSIDRGWISPMARVLITAALGAALIGVVEWELRKGRRSFSGGMLGCGIGVLYVAAFAAHKYYDLLGHSTASLLYTCVTAVCVLIAAHARMLPVAILAVIGGFGTPLLLTTHRDQQVALLTYVIALDVGFLITAYLRRWDELKPLAWAGTLMLFGGWFVSYYREPALWRTAGFILALYLVFHVDAIYCLYRNAIKLPRLSMQTTSCSSRRSISCSTNTSRIEWVFSRSRPPRLSGCPRGSSPEMRSPVNRRDDPCGLTAPA
jgi:uncharacterized membrane protein